MEPGLRLLNAVLMIALPLVLGAWLARRYRQRGILFGFGAVSFIGAQVVHLPLLGGLTYLFRGLGSVTLREHAGLVNAILLGLAAGVCEEGARYLVYRFLAPGARSWASGLMLGAGHGGTEAILLGALAGATALHAAAEPSAAPAVPLLGFVERVFALASHLALSLLVLQAFVRRSWLWVLAAVGWHAVLDAVSVYGAHTISAVALETIIGLFAVTAVAVVFALRPRAGAS
jgi:uncharacterized membrane protein YhfC